jgi:arylsulfatase A-like enzyme
MNSIIVLIAAFPLIPLAALHGADTARPAPKPNIVIILADDLGYGDLSGYGHPKLKTPHLDRMAAEGAKLTHFNCPMPYCAPTRAALLTGRYPMRCGLSQNPAPDGAPDADGLHLPESEITLAQLLKQSGYATGMIGKWHLGHAKPEWLPTHRGFDEYYGIPYSNDMRPVQVLEGERRVEYPVVQATLTQRYTARALDFIERNKARPFFLFLPHAMPHKPLAASEDFYKKSGAGLYGDTMAELDWSVGEVLAKLQALDLDANTLVMFTSDNGATFGGYNGGLRGMKGSSYEGGYRVPCLAWWPGKIPAGHLSAEPAVMMDLFATALNVAGVAPPKERVIDGRDILPLFTSDAKSPHAVIFGQLAAKLATVRDARWKLHVLKPGIGLVARYQPGDHMKDSRAPDGVSILAPYEQATPDQLPGLMTGDAPGAMQLFDLQNDPGEQHDVAAQHSDIVERLKKAFDEMSTQLQATPGK